MWVENPGRLFTISVAILFPVLLFLAALEEHPAWKPSREFYLVACTMQKNEQRFMPEWLEFHLLQGVQRFIVYDNGSQNSTLFLEDYLTLNIVELVPWPFGPDKCSRKWQPSEPMVWPDCQVAALEDCAARYRARTEWLGFWDVDEFIFAPVGRPRLGTTLDRTLESELRRQSRNTRTVRLLGTTFGTSNVSQHFPAPGLLVPMITPALQRRHSFGVDGSSGSQKEIARPDDIFSTNVHSFVFFKKWWRDWRWKVNTIHPEGALQDGGSVKARDAESTYRSHVEVQSLQVQV